MEYGNTYLRTPKERTLKEKSKKKVIDDFCNGIRDNKRNSLKSKSVIEALCNELGYNRGNLEGIELESKIDIQSKYRRFNIVKRMPLSLGEKINFPVPYSLDYVLEAGNAFHECYGFVEDSVVEAFTKVTKQSRTKIKIKGKTEYLNHDGIILLKRAEEHKKGMTAQDIVSFIAQEAKKVNAPLKYVGSFQKQSKEAFVFNPISGRIFVVATNICKTEYLNHDGIILLKRASLYQLELEYYGQINGYNHSNDIVGEMVLLTNAMINDSFRLGYSAKATKLTKFDWLTGNVK